MRPLIELTRRHARRCAVAAALASAACHPQASSGTQASNEAGALDQAPALRPLGDPAPAGDGSAAPWVDCVSALHVTAMRDYGVANAERLADTRPGIRAGARVSDLAPADLRALCDWEACLRTNGYGHICYVGDAGWEQCRVCSTSADCSGLPMSQDDCVAHAGDPGVVTCHVALLEECLLQRAIRLPTDPRETRTCAASEQACSGRLPGDLSAQAAAARHETSQVAVEQAEREFVVGLASDAEPPAVASFWEQQFCMWDGGVPDDLDGGADGWGEGVDATWCAVSDGGPGDVTTVDAGGVE
jgi:hypothetical protein